MRLIKSKFAYQDEEYDDEIADIMTDRFAEADKSNRIKNEDKQEQRGEEPLDQLDFGEFEALKELGFENDQLAGLSSTEAKFIIAAFMEDEEAAMRAYKPRRIRGLRRSRVSPTERIQRLKYRRKNRFKAEYNGRMGRIGTLLSNNLQRISHTDTNQAGIQNGLPPRQGRRQAWRFQYQRDQQT